MAREMVHLSSLLAQRSDELRGLVSGSLSVGTAYHHYYPWLSRMIAGFTHRYPGVTINLLEGTSSELCQAVRERRADLCIASRREGPFRWTPIHEGPLVVLVPERHPLAEGDRVPIDALRTEPFIELNPGLETDNSRFFAKYDLHPNTRFTTSDPTAVRSIVSAGLGISLINDLQAVRTLVGMNVISTFDATVMLLLVLWQMMTYVSPKLTGVAVLPLILIIFGDYFYGKVMHKRFLAKQQAFSTLTDQVQETVSGIRVIKSFVQERKELYAFAKTTLFTKEKNLGVVRLQALVMPLLDLIVGIASLLTLAYGGYLAIYGEINIGQFISFNSYVTMLVWPMMAVGECITSVSQGMASLRRIQEIFDAKPEIVDGDMVDPSIQTLKGDIDIEHLSFAYPDQPTVPVLEDVSVHVKAGETLAVLGRTGSGKSTLPSLLMRLYDVPDGMITIDGHNLREIPLAALRRNIACVPQDNFLFSDTLQNNIAFGSDNKSLEAVQEAAKNACIHDNIMEFPKQYQTLVGERGVTISGGQKQRSSIARALMKDAPILLLDDALSAVDTDTERQILDNLHRLRKGRTTIIVAHRISTIQDADHILVLDEGKVEEYGTHEELLNNGKLYASLYRKQQLEKELHEEGGAAHAE